MPEDFTIGVEEEFLIVDAETRRLRPQVEPILSRAQEEVDEEIRSELRRSQLESGTAVCQTLGDLRAELVRLRRGLAATAERSGCRIAAAGTHPFSSWDEVQVTPKAAYVRLEQDYQQLAREQLVCGCH
ncbi:MAG TPA: glutamate-cysteine ligase family protein, partial [Acidimicrobiales bacterium]|nr:glutamate-cysteine ligase family protein [Acidimicrobiales bacterium]